MPERLYMLGYTHHKKNISAINVNTTSHDWVASIIESSFILVLVRSVDLKNNRVATIHDPIATIHDDNNCELFGNQNKYHHIKDNIIHKGIEAKVIHSTLW